MGPAGSGLPPLPSPPEAYFVVRWARVSHLPIAVVASSALPLVKAVPHGPHSYAFSSDTSLCDQELVL